MLKLNIQLFAASKSTTFSESTNISANTSTLTINIYFSANNTTTYFSNRILNCSCYGQTQSAKVTLTKGGSVSASFTFYNLGHNPDGTGGANWAWDCNTGTQVLGHIGDSGRYTFATIPRQANATWFGDFNDESNPGISFSNPGGFRINARLEFGGVSINRINIPNTGNYTFYLSEEERNLLRQKCTGNSMIVRGVIATCINSSSETHWSWIDRTMTIINANPKFSNFEFEDTNKKTLDLTGNNKNIIVGYSNVKVTIPTAYKAEAIKKATMSTYQFNCGNNAPKTANYSDVNDVSMEMLSVSSGTFNVYAKDSRNNSTMISKVANETLNYVPLSKGNISVSRKTGVSEDTILSFDGKVDLINFGAKLNDIKSAKFRFKTLETDWSDYTDLIIYIDENGNFSYNHLIIGDTQLGFDINKSYQIEVVVEDELSSITYTDTLGSGVPNIAYHKNGISVMGKYDTEVGGPFQIQGQNPFLYSENETICGMWGDKPLYRKMYKGNLSQGSIPHGLTNYRIRNITANFYNTHTDTSFSIPSVRPNYPVYEVGIYIRPTTIELDRGSGSQQSYIEFEIVLEYTKNTD